MYQCIYFAMYVYRQFLFFISRGMSTRDAGRIFVFALPLCTRIIFCIQCRVRPQLGSQSAESLWRTKFLHHAPRLRNSLPPDPHARGIGRGRQYKDVPSCSPYLTSLWDPIGKRKLKQKSWKKPFSSRSQDQDSEVFHISKRLLDIANLLY